MEILSVKRMTLNGSAADILEAWINNRNKTKTKILFTSVLKFLNVSTFYRNPTVYNTCLFRLKWLV
jgi:hypothetical protein